MLYLFTSVICDSSFSRFPAAACSSFPSVPFFTPFAPHEKGKPSAVPEFITREQRVITLKADFSERLRSRKESARNRLCGFRANSGKLRRPVNESVTVPQTTVNARKREKERDEDGAKKKGARGNKNGAQRDGGTSENAHVHGTCSFAL